VSKRVTFPGQSAYDASFASYFNGKSRLTPNCILQPKSAEEVSTAVKVLTAAGLLEPCQVAVRSGGHTSIPGFNNVVDGVTINLLYMNGTNYNADTQLASISQLRDGVSSTHPPASSQTVRLEVATCSAWSATRKT
jgi:hypothetical protein